MSQVELIRTTATNLGKIKTEKKILAGFDGFIDEIIHLVDTRISSNSYSRIETITDYSQKIAEAAGKSCNMEMVSIQSKLGGNGPIMANALIIQGYKTTYIGALGKDKIDPIFQGFCDNCQEVISLAEPGHTDAVEFVDGKILYGKLQSLENVNWSNLIQKVSQNKLIQIINESSLICCTNWTLLPEMNSIYKGLTNCLKEIKDRKTVFIDLSDPAKRTTEDIAEGIALLTEMQQQADVILGLNENESAQIAEVLNLGFEKELKIRAKKIREKSKLHMIMIHPRKTACVASKEGEFEIKGPFTEKPKLSTGAGDNLNSGFCNGYLSGLSPEQCLATGVCTSGFYVRNGRSPKREELITFMNKWADSDCR